MGETPEEFPQRIGPYQILQRLGEGGMGVVYEAEESGPVRRRVAVKVIHAAHYSRDVITRFEAERQALALMNHPGIAKVFSAGATESGEPYFTMELVRGLPIGEYCDLHRLSINERILLFIDVCRAVQHAHQKSVVHRDLKPSNVLVMEQDGARQPKIIDFGVAKALGQQLTEHTLVTLSGTAIGTAAYMSPEQADATMDVDTRSDIYSLGVMLYELLVGALPLDPAQGGIHVFLANIASRRTDPPRPSAKLSGEPASGAVAFSRRTNVKRLRWDLSGDLDAIAMMAMHPDRSLRYPSAASLADDLRRHLDHQPVIARLPSTRDRAIKFIRRHRVGVASTALVVAAVLSGSVLATVGLVRAQRAERIAAQEAAASTQVTAFLTDVFSVNDPGRSRGGALTARELLARGAARVSAGLEGQPLLQARLMQTLGTVHAQLGLYDEARPLFDGALRIRERELGANDTLVAETLQSIGDVARFKGQTALADSALHRALAIRVAALGSAHSSVVTTMAALATLRYAQGRLSEAESIYARALSLDSMSGRPDDAARARRLRGLGVIYWGQGRFEKAEPLFNRALEIELRTLGPDHYDVGGTLNNLGGVYYGMGKYQQALESYERALPIFEKSLDASHPNVFGLYNNFGETYWKLGRFAPAESLLRRSLVMKEKVLGASDPSIANTLHALAGVLRDEQRYGEAESAYRRALAIRERASATNPRPVVETLLDFAELMRRTGRAPEAARFAARAKDLSATQR
jgi:non-specific serine/threonine protein kinase/serine/threonine-protein kinase